MFFSPCCLYSMRPKNSLWLLKMRSSFSGWKGYYEIMSFSRFLLIDALCFVLYVLLLVQLSIHSSIFSFVHCSSSKILYLESWVWNRKTPRVGHLSITRPRPILGHHTHKTLNHTHLHPWSNKETFGSWEETGEPIENHYSTQTISLEL